MLIVQFNMINPKVYLLNRSPNCNYLYNQNILEYINQIVYLKPMGEAYKVRANTEAGTRARTHSKRWKVGI